MGRALQCSLPRLSQGDVMRLCGQQGAGEVLRREAACRAAELTEGDVASRGHLPCPGLCPYLPQITVGLRLPTADPLPG